MNIKSLLLILMLGFPCVALSSSECVILLHGLARSSSSMEELEEKLGKASFYVTNVNYPSRTKNIEELSELAVNAGLEQCQKESAYPINFVTHSLGGILVRQYYKKNDPKHLKRVVMLGPPNKGSEVVDSLKNVAGFELINGPAGMQLGTKEEDIPKSLGAVNFNLGVIAGTRSINLLLSNYLPNPDDGKVSLESTKVKGMCGFVALPVTHPFMMKNNSVIAQVISFLKSGEFDHEDAINYCPIP